MIQATLKPRWSVLRIPVSYQGSLLLESTATMSAAALPRSVSSRCLLQVPVLLALPQLSLGIWMKLSLYKLGEREWTKHFSKVRASEHLEGRVKLFILLYH